MNYREKERKKRESGGHSPPAEFFRGGEEGQGMTADIAAESATGGQGAAAAGPESGAAADRSRTTGSVLEAHYRFLLWLVPALSRFPRDQKFLLGDRIQGTALDVLERLIEATYSKRREEPLTRVNLGLEKLRYFCRLAHGLRYLDRRCYEHAARSLDETGRRAGAWRKAHRAREGT